MKNVFVVLAFMLMSSLAFAGSGEKAELDSAADVKVENFVGVGLDVISISDSESLNTETDLAKECTIKGEFTITDERGRSFSWKGTLTFVGVSCSELLKDLMAQ